MGLANIIIDDAAPREKAYKLGSENGLYLLINPSGSRWWRFDYRFEGKRRTLSMGVYPEIILAEVLPVAEKSAPRTSITVVYATS